MNSSPASHAALRVALSRCLLVAALVLGTSGHAGAAAGGRPQDNPLAPVAAAIAGATAEPARTPAPDAADESAPASDGRQLNLQDRPRAGDFDAMLERRMIRVLVPYSRTLYFNDKGRERGLTAELVRDFEQFVNRKHAKQLGKRPLTIYLVPTTRDQLLMQLIAGYGDISAGNLTITDARLTRVDFVTQPDRKPNRELLVTGPASPAIDAVEQLAGRRVHVRPSSSYHESVMALSRQLVAAGKPAITIAPLPEALEDEDVLEMLNAGLIEYAVVDDWKAKSWAQVLPAIQVRQDLVLREEGRVGWAIRKGSPQLAAILDDFYRNHAVKQGVSEYRLAQFHKRVKQIGNNTADAEHRQFERVIALFRKYGAQYDFDPLMLAAQGYQESRLRQDAKSHVGAIGVMQIMPATGAELDVGNIRELEPNIHAGAKYMDKLMTQYFKDAQFSEDVRPLFAFASYNAGPGNISKMRREAARRGLDPDKWFNNVEIVVAERIGIETTTYVRNIYKYYCAYKLMTQADQQRRRAREQLGRNDASGVD